MGLTANSTGINAVDNGIVIEKEKDSDKIIALAGNPNVGKSTVFNTLTGLNQHTGNWPGKTVATAIGKHIYQETTYYIVDLPGTYSLMAHSAEEEVARDFICFGGSDATIVVCDATCLERNLNLVLQTIEITPNVIVCVNLMDEAKKKKIKINLKSLEERLGVPVIATSARSNKGLDLLVESTAKVAFGKQDTSNVIKIRYLTAIEEAIAMVQPVIETKLGTKINSRWLSLKLLDYDESLGQGINTFFETDIMKNKSIYQAILKGKEILEKAGISPEKLRDRIVSCIVLQAEELCNDIIETEQCRRCNMDRKLDRILTNKITGIPIMLLLLCLIFWITITGANYPSQWLSTGLFWIQDRLTDFFMWMNAPDWLHGALVLGVYRVLAWVISVMLPPMAIFFPMFTLLEDFGYLPRIAFNLDHYFKKACACGKQALTMCMGFGCNAAGIVGCRIIDSPRERLIAIITNNFVPCNGRFAQPHKGK